MLILQSQYVLGALALRNIQNRELPYPVIIGPQNTVAACRSLFATPEVHSGRYQPRVDMMDISSFDAVPFLDHGKARFCCSDMFNDRPMRNSVSYHATHSCYWILQCGLGYVATIQQEGYLGAWRSVDAENLEEGMAGDVAQCEKWSTAKVANYDKLLRRIPVNMALSPNANQVQELGERLLVDPDYIEAAEGEFNKMDFGARDLDVDGYDAVIEHESLHTMFEIQRP
ncbi:hypothetical protein MRB53_041763 [Persea americana]|nr:hypothetical protein MRB53_041763 [Persea americana]